MFKLLVWDCYAWSAWQFFQVKDRKGNYRDIPGNWNQYAGYFPLWRLSYSIIPYIRMKFEQNGLGFQNLYNIPQGVEVPWLTYQPVSYTHLDVYKRQALAGTIIALAVSIPGMSWATDKIQALTGSDLTLTVSTGQTLSLIHI